MSADDLTPSTHDWHVGSDGTELVIRRDEEDTIGVHLGHENIDDAHATTIVTSRLLEMIDAVAPGAVHAYAAAQELTDAEVRAAMKVGREFYSSPVGVGPQFMRAVLAAAREVRS